MPWQEKSAERLRMEFIVVHESEQYSFTEPCELFGISREAGYRCLRRFTEDGIEGLRRGESRLHDERTRRGDVEPYCDTRHAHFFFRVAMIEQRVSVLWVNESATATRRDKERSHRENQPDSSPSEPTSPR